MEYTSNHFPQLLSILLYLSGLVLLLSPLLYLIFPNTYSSNSKFGIPKSLSAVATPMLIFFCIFILSAMLTYAINSLNKEVLIFLFFSILVFVIRGSLKVRELNKDLSFKRKVFVDLVLVMAMTGILYPVSLLLSFKYRVRFYPEHKIEFYYLLKCFAVGIAIFCIPIWLNMFL